MAGAVVLQVLRGSTAEELGITKDSEILTVNGRTPLDVLDFRFEVAGTDVTLEVKSPDGQITEYEIEKDYDDFLGIEFVNDLFDGVRTCQNRCPFCFVRNLPGGLRKSLYVRDDDYRLSFMFGNFITLTNLSEMDFDRIIAQRLSPLYVSVHTTDPGLRRQLLGNPAAGDLMGHLDRLAQGSIEFHFQVVVTPGLNDGDKLLLTLEQLRSLGDHALSIGVVPVGLTRFCRVPGIRLLTSSECQTIIDAVERWKEKSGFARAYIADEMMINAGYSIPEASYYGEYPQLENGVGMVRLFMDEARDMSACAVGRGHGRIGVVTGRSFQPFMLEFLKRYEQSPGLTVVPVVVPNSFFGETVTVAGLVVGEDIRRAVAQAAELHGRMDRVLVPASCLNDGRFLDDMTLDQLSISLGTPVVSVPASPTAIDERIVNG